MHGFEPGYGPPPPPHDMYPPPHPDLPMMPPMIPFSSPGHAPGYQVEWSIYINKVTVPLSVPFLYKILREYSYV